MKTNYAQYINYLANFNLPKRQQIHEENLLRFASNKSGNKNIDNYVDKVINWTQTKTYSMADFTLQTITRDDVKKVFEYFGVGTTTNQDNTLSIEKYARVNHYHTFSDLGFEENKFFQYISKINQSAVFAGSKITSLGILEEIGEDAIFGNSEITCLGNLWKIGGNADFDDSLIKNTGNLKIIGGNARFKNSK